MVVQRRLALRITCILANHSEVLSAFSGTMYSMTKTCPLLARFAERYLVSSGCTRPGRPSNSSELVNPETAMTAGANQRSCHFKAILWERGP